MKKINLRRVIYRLRHQVFTLNNGVILIALMIATGWVWGSLGVMQKNYSLQKELDDKTRQLLLTQLDTQNAQLQQRFYMTDEYKELAVRKNLGLGLPGEKVLILPPNSSDVNDGSSEALDSVEDKAIESNFNQWISFLTGKNNSDINN